eukprot:2401892-Amphidinium_carterae.1
MCYNARTCVGLNGTSSRRRATDNRHAKTNVMGCQVLAVTGPLSAVPAVMPVWSAMVPEEEQTTRNKDPQKHPNKLNTPRNR